MNNFHSIKYLLGQKFTKLAPPIYIIQDVVSTKLYYKDGADATKYIRLGLLNIPVYYSNFHLPEYTKYDGIMPSYIPTLLELISVCLQEYKNYKEYIIMNCNKINSQDDMIVNIDMQINQLTKIMNKELSK